MVDFQTNGYDRKGYKLKDIRNDLMGIIGSEKPWEVAIGQILGNLTYNTTTDFNLEGSIHNYLGGKLVQAIIPRV